MLNINEIQQLIARKLERESVINAPESLYEPIHYIMSIGGKRLRPMLVMLAAQLYNRNPEEVLDAAIGVEVFHNFTLMHDDIMDHSPIRRGKPTVHNKWNVSTAILAGDTMMVMAYDYFLKSKTENVIEVVRTFNQVAREVCEGQQYDMDFELRLDVTEDEYMKMIRLKTAVLMAASLKIGGLVAGAYGEDLELLYLFGEKIGLAFQLKDDLLDVFGDVNKFGKQTGNDIITNKKTYLLVKCLEETGKEDRESLEHWLSRSDNPDEKISAVTGLYKKYDIDGKTNKLIEDLYIEGIGFLDKVSVEARLKEPLYELSGSLKIREN